MDARYVVRYLDPQFHLRLRLHGVPGRLLSEAWPMVQDALAPLVQDRRLASVRLDTYVRETVRYAGREGILLAEQIFAADSAAVLAVLRDADRRG